MYLRKYEEQMKKMDVVLLFDAGAIFKDISNEEVARRILGTDDCPFFGAVLFFHDKENLLYYIDSEDMKVPKKAPTDNHFATLKGKYQKPIFLYLDQAHTIGTDIKLNDSNASCITTVSDLLSIKDFLQALLRARQTS